MILCQLMPQIRQIEAPLNPEIPRLEALPQSVVAYGRDLAPHETIPFHQHRRAQLIYASQGVMNVTTSAASYVVPPHQAVWMPGATGHRIDARSAVAMRTLYIEPNATLELPRDVCVLQISALLRELILVAVDEGPHYESHHPQARLSAVILDQICVQSITPLALPMPTDPRLLRVTTALISNPGDGRDLADWAHLAGASKRTLGRLFMAQTGMSFRTWRQQCRLLRALELLATGENITSIALILNYESTSAFIAMFRRYLGTTPARYLRHNSQ